MRAFTDAELLEERSVCGHLKVDARRRQDLVAQEAERRDRDDDRHHRCRRSGRTRSAAMSDAGVLVSASAWIPSTRRQAALTAR